jgi:RHS repeat-associated protein
VRPKQQKHDSNPRHPANYNEVAIVEVSGAATSSPFDVSAFNSEAQAASDQPSSSAATTTANDIVLGYVNGVFDFGFTVGSGFTLDTTFNATYDIIEHQRQSSAGSISATATSSDAWRGWGDLMVAFKPGSTTTTTTALQYYHPDHLSPRVTTDSSGNVIGQQGHYPFGESWYASSTTTKYLFTSYERDTESGNDYAQARTYVNRLGRFASPDPLAGLIGDPQSLNRYSYVRNEPIDFEDPSGMKTGCAVAFTPHSEGSLGIKISGPSMDDGDADALTELLEPPDSCGNPNCTVILDGATAPCVFAYSGGGGAGTGTANDSVMFINCTVDNPFYTGGCVGLQLDPDGNGKWIAWVPKGRLVTAAVDGTKAGTTAFMDGNYWAWQTGPIPQGTLMNSCSNAESCALSIFFPQVSRPIEPNGGGGRGFSPQEGLEAIHNAGNIAAPINNPAFPAIWYGSQLGGFGLTYVAPLVPPGLATLHTVALGCALSDTCRDNVIDGVVGLIPDAEDGRMPTTPVGLAFFIYSRIHQ